MFRKWFNQASEIVRLSNELDFTRRQLGFAQVRIDDAEAKVEALEKSVKSEREKRDKFICLAMDKIAGKTSQSFERTMFPKPVEPVKPDADPTSVELAAELNREADIAAGFDPQPLDFYVKAIENDPQKYLPS